MTSTRSPIRIGLLMVLNLSVLGACQAPKEGLEDGRDQPGQPEAVTEAPAATTEVSDTAIPTESNQDSDEVLENARPTTVAFPTAAANPLSKGPVAPELDSDTWLNSEPISMASLRGDVVVVDFWTYG